MLLQDIRFYIKLYKMLIYVKNPSIIFFFLELRAFLFVGIHIYSMPL